MNNENLARAINGKESEGITMNMSNKVDNSAFNEQVSNYEERLKVHNNKVKETAISISENMNNVEIMPIYNYILVSPFTENPFQKINVTESGLVTDFGGASPQFKNRDTGELEEEDQFISVGTVLEVGKECKYIKEGDIIMWTKPSEVPVPFFKQGLVLVNENRVIVVINEGLKNRFNQ